MHDKAEENLYDKRGIIDCCSTLFCLSSRI